MKVDATITKMYESRKGTSKQGNAYCMTDLAIKYNYKAPGFTPEEHEMVVTLSGEPDMELLKSAITNQKVLPFNLFFSMSENQDKTRAFNNIRAYLPEGYVIKPL